MALQALYGNVTLLDGSAGTGSKVRASLSTRGQLISGSLVQKLTISSVVDLNGDFSINVPQGSEIELSIDNHGTHTITITNDASRDISTYLQES